MLQSCSGHSRRTGEIGHGVAVFTFLVGICTFRPVRGLIRLFVSLSPFTGDGLSSFDLRFSGRGGRKAVGEVDGVFAAPELLPELLDDDCAIVVVAPAEAELVVVVLVVVVVGVPVVVEVVVRPPRPFAPPFRSLLCTYNI